MSPPPKDPSQYPYEVTDQPRELTASDLAFIARYTGKSEQSLRGHIFEVWRKAKQKVWIYKCIQEFMFLTPKIHAHSYYTEVQKAHQNRGNRYMLHLDVGCCMGQDIRQLVTDGWKQQELVAMDLDADYWELGKEFFQDADKLQVPFLTGSMTDDSFVSSNDCHLQHCSAGNLMGAADFLWSGAVLHVLSRSDSSKYLANAKLLLRPGGGLYGYALGSPEARAWAPTPNGKQTRFLHSEESLYELLLSLALSDIKVESSPRFALDSDDASEKQYVRVSFSANKQRE